VSESENGLLYLHRVITTWTTNHRVSLTNRKFSYKSMTLLFCSAHKEKQTSSTHHNYVNQGPTTVLILCLTSGEQWSPTGLQASHIGQLSTSTAVGLHNSQQNTASLRVAYVKISARTHRPTPVYMSVINPPPVPYSVVWL